MSALDRSENVIDHDSTAIASVRSQRGRVLLVSPVPTHPPTAGNRIRILRMTQAIESLGYVVDFAHVLREQGDPELMKAHWGERYLPIDYSNPARQQQSLGG